VFKELVGSFSYFHDDLICYIKYKEYILLSFLYVLCDITILKLEKCELRQIEFRNLWIN
jgi:hypothetical protein